MTKQEIEALIDAKIAGQGSAIDAGSALPTILKGILEMASTPEYIVDLGELPRGESKVSAELAEKLRDNCLGVLITIKGEGKSLFSRNDALSLNENILNETTGASFDVYDAMYGYVATTSNADGSFIKTDGVYFLAVDVQNKRIFFAYF